MAKRKSQNKPLLPRRKSASIAPYYRTHRKNTLKERPISISNFEGGTIVRMDYFGKTTGVFKSAYYLIIGENTSDRGKVVLGGADFDKYTHVFDIGYVPASVLKFLISLTRYKKLEEFVFARTAFSYYNFPVFGKSLYNKLLPVMNKSYRKLIRSTKNIRRTYIVEYDFGKIRGAIKPKFIFPNLEEEAVALKETADEFGLEYNVMDEISKSGRLVSLTPTIWSSIDNTNSWQINITQDQVRIYAETKGKSPDVTDRIISGMKSSQTFYAPIIFKYFDSYYCVAGNTRLMTAMALKVIPKVYIFAYDENTEKFYKQTTEDTD